MQNIKFLTLIAAYFLVVGGGCNYGPDPQTDIGGGYIFRHEGALLNDILGKKDIPANVIACYYNKNFIVAKQMPDRVDHEIYGYRPDYKEGRNRLYFWLIVHKPDVFLGPMNEKEFEEAKKEYGVPDEKELRAIVIDTTNSKMS